MIIKRQKIIIFVIPLAFLAGCIFTSGWMTAYAADTKDNDSNVENWSEMKLWYR